MNTTTLLTNFAISGMLIIGFGMLIFYMLGQDKTREFLLDSCNSFGKNMDKFKKVLSDISLALTPKSDSDIGEWYRKFLMQTKYTNKEFFSLKNTLFVIVLVFYIAVIITDSNNGIAEIYKKFEYVSDPMFNAAMYTDEEKLEIIEQKNYMFDYIKENAGFNVLMTFDQDSAVNIIQNYVSGINETNINDSILATEIYKKMVAYQEFKSLNFMSAVMFALLAYFLPEAVIFMVNFFNKSGERAEKRFMKRLIIMNGSIKPTDFMMVLSELIDKSKYFKKILQEIEDSNKKNYEENTKIYQKYIMQSKDLETKLFFEKLDEANNYDFDQAILNIKNEFNLDKRMQTRKVKKMVESIHVWGLLGFMGLIVFLIMYLLMPWMTAYDLGAVM